LGLTQACLGCHTEEHRKQLATDCLQCHNYNAWKPAPLFDHDKTEYTLTGKHRHVKCSKCHPVLRDRAPGDRSDASYVKYAGIDARTCSGCHQDVHRGKLGSNCATCHRTSGWLDIAGRNFDHSRTRFPLKGLHARVPCEKCHGERRRRKEVAFAACSDCHKDPHQRQFASYADGGRCETCHSEEGFLPSLFTLADHEKTRYPLTGSHLAQPCIACHTEIADKRGARRRYKFDDKSCEGCHEDVHVAQFKQHGRWRPVGQEATPQKMRNQKQCQDCHRITFWTDLDFDHDRDTSYSLVGAHRNVRCQGCHLAVGERGKRFVRYRPIGHACKTCHDIQPAALN
ncbi:MAG: hypothetical protein OEN01_01920, partial [Candidatus Krumholzibacteria bacterium]|nr:hypothetical protein [Candidatus Krumholzibacteria bacterium]